MSALRDVVSGLFAPSESQMTSGAGGGSLDMSTALFQLCMTPYTEPHPAHPSAASVVVIAAPMVAVMRNCVFLAVVPSAVWWPLCVHFFIKKRLGYFLIVESKIF